MLDLLQLKVACRLLRKGLPKSTGLWPLLSDLFVHWFLTDQMQGWNLTHASGRDAPLMVVPFVGGADPPVRLFLFFFNVMVF
jgi:hypothetical protein